MTAVDEGVDRDARESGSDRGGRRGAARRRRRRRRGRPRRCARGRCGRHVGGLGEGGDRQRRLDAVEAVEKRGLGVRREVRDDAAQGVAHRRDRAGVGEGGDDVDVAIDAAGVEPPDRGDPGQGLLERGGDVDLELAGGEAGDGHVDADLHRRGRRRRLGPRAAGAGRCRRRGRG